MDPGIRNQRWKIKALQESIDSNPIHTPFFILTETHLKSYHLDAEVHISGYSCYRADRVNRVRGGAAIYLHNSITVEKSRVFSNSYCEIACVYSKELDMIIAGIYRPPLSPFDKFDECLVILHRFIDEVGSTPELHIAGDFNLPFVNWRTSSVDPGCSILLSDRQTALSLIAFMEEHFLLQLIDEPTRNSNILDLVFSNNSDSVHSTTVAKTEMSDQDFVNCVLLHPDLLPPSQTPERLVFTPSCPLDDINLNSADWGAINSEFQSMDWSNVTDTRNDQDTAWKLFEDTVANICCKHAPSHTRGMEASAKSSIPRPRRELLRKNRRLNGHINAIKYCSRTPRNNTKLEQLNKERATIELLLKDNIKRERLLQEVAAISKLKKEP